MTVNKNILSLFELTTKIQRNISNNFSELYWVKAELVKLNRYPQSGHCYPELVEKDNNKIKAKVNGIIWRDDYNFIEAKFKKVTHETIVPGRQMLFQVMISFSPLYGMSLVIYDIDPAFTLGALAYERQRTIDKLTEMDILEKNKSLPIPRLLQRIAVISADTSKGYMDFIQTLNKFSDKYSIMTKLYHAILQGDAAVLSLIAAFEDIRRKSDYFDAVFLIRGGGDDIGLNCYDNFDLAREIATFPIPVITGIGHSTNNTVADLVAAVDLITPTEAANYVCSGFIQLDDELSDIQNNIINTVSVLLDTKKQNLSFISNNIVSFTNNFLLLYKNKLNNISNQICMQPRIIIQNSNNHINNIVNNLYKLPKFIFDNEMQKISNIEKRLELLDPEDVLKRGYSISYCNNKVIKNVEDIHEGDIVETHVYKGIIESKTTKITTNGE